ncbi:KAS2 [Auxenochlorella protothecoides x Auxenochlorella symbiontica]
MATASLPVQVAVTSTHCFGLREPRRKRQWARQTRCHASAAGKPKRRVVVTGQGVVTSLGQSTQQFYDQLLAGASGITHIEGFDTSDYSTKIAGEVKSVDAAPYVARKWVKRMDEVMKFMFVAGKQALEDAGLPFEGPGLEDLDRKLCGILIGTAMGGMTTFASGVEALTLSGHRKMNPFCIPFSIGNMGGAMLAMDLGFMGPNYSISTACATGNYCIISAANHIRNGDAVLMLAGGADAAVIPSGIGGFIACKALSRRNDEPERASRPWDAGRDGFVMGEGAGVLVLEELEHARARGATILAEFIGGAATCDAHHMTEPEPSGRGVRLCLERGLAAAGVAAEEVTYVNAHGTSTPAGDVAEFRAIRAVLGHDGLRINSSKGAIGHLLGAAGAVEAVATIQALRTGWLHPNLNLDEPDEGVDASVLVGGVKEQADVKVALSNSFGFGGHNSCVLFRKFEE